MNIRWHAASMALWAMGWACAHHSSAPVDARPGSTPSRTSSIAKPDADAPIAPPESTIVVLGCGYLLVENHGDTHFSILFRARQAQHSRKDPSILVLDGVLVQSTLTTAAQIGAPDLRGDALLRRHIDWESKYESNVRHWPALSASGDPVDLGIDGVRTMLWGYHAPTPFEVEGATVDRMLFLESAVDDLVVTLAAPLRPGDAVKPVSDTLARAMQTLRRERAPIDVFALSRAERDGHTEGECSRPRAP